MTDEQFKEFVKLVVKRDEESNGHYYVRLPKWLLPLVFAVISAAVTFAFTTQATNAKHDAILDEHTKLLDYHTRLLDQIQSDLRSVLQSQNNVENRRRK